jgi:hypothetical protein
LAVFIRFFAIILTFSTRRVSSLQRKSFRIKQLLQRSFIPAVYQLLCCYTPKKKKGKKKNDSSLFLLPKVKAINKFEFGFAGDSIPKKNKPSS